MSSRLINLYAFIAIVSLLFASIYLQVFDGLEPCPLCTLQRLTFGLLAFFFLLGVLLPLNRMIRFILNLFTLTTAVMGAGLAGRQIWLQHFANQATTECGASLQYLLQMLPWHEALARVLVGSAECTERGFLFLFLNIAEWSFCWFLGFSMVTVYLLLKDLQQTKNKRNH
ncbi:MAG: hypothetical protein A3F14_00155 [Gammaproteobacteria bacterium RIFCSPHIGHO2_12_FULL_43_28]|nr:MAG: hypothetical protein A3F14_00155 [Gammaproteobacteria bacterium RIFCSPHIGHO2_12_FULL_43_28]